MNKSRIVLVSVSVAITVVVLAAAFFTWLSWSDKIAAIEGDDEHEGLEAVTARATSLSRKSVYPCAESVAELVSNAQVVTTWKAETFKLAARGDRAFPKTTSAAFKEFLVTDAKRLSNLPGAVEGKLVKAGFAFGPFREYIAEGKMPTDGDLPKLQRQWDDLATIVELLGEVGVAELTDVQLKAKAAAEPEEEMPKTKKNKRKAKRNAVAVADAPKGPAKETYQVAFRAKPLAFVKSINVLTTAERFIVIDDFSFSRPRDVIADALGGDKREEAKTQSGGRRRARRAAVVETPKEEQSEDEAGTLVTDPQMDEPMNIQMTISVYDFRTLEETEKKEEVGE